MKKNVILFLIILSISASIKNSSAQILFFDSVKTMVSSSVYDYKNPEFDSYRNGGPENFSWLAYERHTGNSSDIMIRKVNYSSNENEIVITNTVNAMNINPSIYKDIIVWQSNVRGNWDIYYSILLNGIAWSSPILLDSSDSEETNPYILNNNLYPEQYNYYYLVYKSENSIRFKKYKTITGVWSNDTIVTDGTYEDLNPVIVKGNTAAQFGIVFLRKYASDYTRLCQRAFYENYNGPVAWDNVYEIYQPSSQNNMSVSSIGSDFITYSYDTLNTTNILGFGLGEQNYKEIITKNVPGKHLTGKGSLMGIVTDLPYYFFTAFCTLAEYSDSLCLTFINRPSTFNQNPQYKKIFLGDTNTLTNFDISQPIFSQQYFFRIKVVWEETLNNRTFLVESYMTDVVGAVSNNNSNATGYRLNQNYPNPFNPKTKLEFGIMKLGFVSLKVFDMLGKEVAVLVNEKLNPGNYSVDFNGESLPSGVYFYKLVVSPSNSLVVSSSNSLETGSFVETKRMILLK